MAKKDLIVRIAMRGRKHPEHRKFYIVLLATVVLARLIRKKLWQARPKAKEWAVAAAAMAIMVVGFANNITDGAATPYSTNDAEAEAAAFVENADSLINGKIEIAAYVSEESLPWNLNLVNNLNPLDEDYKMELKGIGRGYEVDSRIYDALMSMLNDGWNKGLNLMVCSAYRSYDTQVDLYTTAVNDAMRRGMTEDEAKEYASFSYSAPGASEHQAAIAVDIVARQHQSLDNAYANTAEAQWLYEHCAEYGFILRYPKDKTDITGIKYEPWHFRYVGKEAATIIMKDGLTLEEYLQIYYPEYCDLYLTF